MKVSDIALVLAATVLIFTIVAGVAFIAGRGSAPLGCVRPVIVIKLAVASCPINF